MWWNQLTKPLQIDEVFDLSQIQPITVAQFEAIARQLRISSPNYEVVWEKGKRNSCANVRFKHSNPLLKPTFWNTNSANGFQTRQAAIA